MSYLLIIVGLAVGAAAGFFYRKTQIEGKQKEMVEKSESILRDAKNKSREIVFEAKNEALELQNSLKKEEREINEKFQQMEDRILKRESEVDRKNDEVEKLREKAEHDLDSLRKRKKKLKLFIRKVKNLKRIASMSKEEARELLISKVEEEYKDDIVSQIRKLNEN